jgi:hypothetical protein
MVLGWLDTRAAEDFATRIAREIRDSMPPTDQLPARKELGKRAKKIDRVISQTNAFGQANRLNFYKKAKLANTLKWSLKEAGYSELFIEEMVRVVLANL